MNIRILHLIEGARQATGLTVVIDVFRAMTVEAYLMHGHAASVIPMGRVEDAFAYRDAHPGTLLCGERGGRMVDGFDFGNSPSQLEHADLAGKTVVHTTSAGTQGIANAVHADEIITGSLANARAIAAYIRQKNPSEVSLVCMGLAGERETTEDTLCARYIRSLLEGRPLENMEDEIEILRQTDGAKFFDPSCQDVFPRRDFELSTQLSVFPFVLRYHRGENGRPGWMERVEVEGNS